METKTKIDWISYTIPFEEHSEQANELSWVNAVKKHILRDEPTKSIARIAGNSWADGVKRPPYTFSKTQLGITAMASPRQSEILIEISGLGCDILRQYGFLELALNHDNVTRVDLAIDVLCETRPREVLNKQIDKTKFKTTSTMLSESGETVYIGSRKSSRYLRIYRYDKDHPRKDWLRFEFVLKKEFTPSLIRNLFNGSSVMQEIQTLGVIWGITHPAFKFPIVESELEGIRGSVKQNKTERWLIEQCAPAFKKLVRDGKIENPNEWLKQYFGV